MFPIVSSSSSFMARPLSEFKLNDDIIDWMTGNFTAPRPCRPKTLILNGTSRLGKTEFARSLGEHAYIANMWDLGALDGLPDSFWNFGYIVFDDISWDSIKGSAKSWFGAQRDFSVSDKYRRKRRIRGGIPCIFLVNPEDFSGELLEFVLGNWGQQNTDVVTLSDRLY